MKQKEIIETKAFFDVEEIDFKEVRMRLSQCLVCNQLNCLRYLNEKLKILTCNKCDAVYNEQEFTEKIFDNVQNKPSIIKKIKLYTYTNDEIRNEIPNKHLVVTHPRIQRNESKDFFEKNMEIWSKLYDKKEGNPYKYHLDVLKSILKNYRHKKTLLEVGCGAGIPLLAFLRNGFSAKGCDFTDSAVAMTKANLRLNGYDANLAFKADIEDSQHLPSEKFDIITSVGVFPHLTDDKQALRNVKNRLNKKGIALLQFRNDLFNMFALNAYSKDFFEKLIDFETLPKFFQRRVQKFHNDKFSDGGINPEFSILSKFHNPLTIKEDLFEPVGFIVKNIHFFHYHRLPPNFELANKKLFRKLGDEIENSHDWRGHFMASSFIVEAQKQ